MLTHEVFMGIFDVRKIESLAAIIISFYNTSIHNVSIEVSILTDELWRILAHLLLVIMGLADLRGHLLCIDCIFTLKHFIKEPYLILLELALWSELEVLVSRNEKLIFESLVHVLDHDSGNLAIVIFNIVTDLRWLTFFSVLLRDSLDLTVQRRVVGSIVDLE